MGISRAVVFVAGAHGAGKGHFCTNLAPLINAQHLSASSLIRNRKNIGAAKAIVGIDQNQTILVEELRRFESHKSVILLDGHFCLFNEEFYIKQLPSKLFELLSIDYVVLLTCDPTEILNRLQNRDNHASGLSVNNIKCLQAAERTHSRNVSDALCIPVTEIDVTTEPLDLRLSELASEIRGYIVS